MKTSADFIADGFPIAKATVTFLPPEQGGRHTMPHLSGVYRPHIVIQDPGVRQATYGPDGNGNEFYLGVQFFDSTNDGEFGVPYHCSMVFMYHARVDYSKATPDATFTVREGGRVVGFGVIVSIAMQGNVG